MKQMLKELLFLTALLSMTIAQTTDLFFSEYIEGASYNKALEIYNGTGATVDLANYLVLGNYNGNPFNDTLRFPIGTMLNSGEVYVIVNDKASSEIIAEADTIIEDPYASGTSFIASFNGDDARGLFKINGSDTTCIDLFGFYDISEDTSADPGTGWDVAGVTAATKDHTIVRKPSVTSGNPDWTASAGTNADDSEWAVYDKDTFGHLGIHPSVNVTFQVDMSEETVSADGVHIAGSLNGWSTDATELTDEDGDSVYTVTVAVIPGDTILYTLLNGNSWGGQEDNTGLEDCGVDNGFGAYNRILVVPDADYTAPVVCFSSCVGCNEVYVTFQVDMSEETVSADGVHIAGGLNGWSTDATELTDDDGDSVYTVMVALTIGDSIQYTLINGNSWSGQEDNTGLEDCGVDNGFGAYNRLVVVPAEDYDVPVVCFSSCLACDAVYITFQVDMANEEVSENGVHITGSFQGWDPAGTEMFDDDGDSVYTVTVGLESGTEVFYKFVNGNAWGDDESVPSSCATDNNRTFTPGVIDETVPVVCFGSCESCVPPNYQTATVTFQADISDMVTFDPAVHWLEIRGTLNGWAGGDTLKQDLFDPDLYKIDITFEENVGNEVAWKFKANPDTDWNNGGWETGEDHTFIWSGVDTVFDPLKPDILPTGEDLLNDVTLTFEVQWIDGTLIVYTGEPFPVKPDTIIVNGSYLNGWYTWGDCMGSDCETPAGSEMPRLVDDDGDDIFTGTLALPAGHSNLFMSKMGAYYPGIDSLDGQDFNGVMDNEGGFGADRAIIIPVSATEYTFEAIFGDNNPENPWLTIDDRNTDFVPNSFTLLGNYPNPFNPETNIIFDLDVTADVTVIVYNILGKEINTIYQASSKPGRYTVTWHGRDKLGRLAPTGVYIYKVEANNKSLTGKMLMLK